MQFVAIGLDGTDEKAQERRAAARQNHIAMGDKLLKSGNLTIYIIMSFQSFMGICYS